MSRAISQALSNLNEQIRLAKSEGAGESLRDMLRQASESSMLVQALRESETELQSHINHLEQKEAAERREAKRKAKVESLAKIALKTKDTKGKLEECDKRITQTLKELILERIRLNTELKENITQFFEFGERCAPSFFELYGHSTGAEISSEAQALFQNVKAEADVSACFVTFGEHGSRVWQTLGNPANFVNAVYPISDAIASNLGSMMKHTTRQEFFRLQPVPLRLKG